MAIPEPGCCDSENELLRKILLNLNILANSPSPEPVQVQDEGTVITDGLVTLNFIGAGVTASAVGGDVTVNIPGGGGGGNFLYSLERFVDPVNGSDATGTGAVENPFKTLAATLASITTASDLNRFVIRASAGIYPEPNVVWKDFVSIVGAGLRMTRIANGISYTMTLAIVPPLSYGRMIFQGIDSALTFVLDPGQGPGLEPNMNIHVISCRCTTLTYNGGKGFNILNYNNGFAISCLINNLNIISGQFHAYGSAAVFSSITLDDEGAPFNGSGVKTLLEQVGGQAQGTVTLNGACQFISRGAENIFDIAGITAGGFTPIWETDAGSQTTGVVSGIINFIIDEVFVVLPVAAFIITKEDFLFCNATAAPFAVTLPNATLFHGKTIVVKKTDASLNTVTVTPVAAQTIDGAATFVLSSQYETVSIISNGTNWMIV